MRRYRTIFLSDFHIGAKSFDAPALLDFLKHTESDSLYLVGDIIDGWKMSKRWHWNDDITAVLDELVRKARAGTRIFYIPGNHDEAVRWVPIFRRLRFARRMGITIRDRVMHPLADGRRMLVLHGDQFDRALLGGMSRWSDRIYDRLLDLLRGHEAHATIVIDGALKPFSLAKFLGRQGQKALDFINDFERMIYREALRVGADGVICGHTHIPALKRIRTVVYANCGSWLRGSHTALVEDNDGNLELLDWPSAPQTLMSGALFPDLPAVRIIAPPPALLTQRLIDSIRRTWPAAGEQAAGVRSPAAVNSVLCHVPAHQIVTQPLKGDVGMRNQVSGNFLHDIRVAAFGLETVAEG